MVYAISCSSLLAVRKQVKAPQEGVENVCRSLVPLMGLLFTPLGVYMSVFVLLAAVGTDLHEST